MRLHSSIQSFNQIIFNSFLLFTFQFGLIIYSTDAQVVFQINSVASDSVADLIAAINGASGPRKLTGTPLALQEAANQLTQHDRDDAFFPDVAMVMTDGRSNFPFENTQAALQQFSDELKAATS